MSNLLSQEWAERYARESAYAFGAAGAHDYLPRTAAQAANWQPHQWVVEAIRTAFGNGLRGRADTKFMVLGNPPPPVAYTNADEPTEAQLVAGLKECEPLGELIDWREGFGRDEMRKVWAAMQAARGLPQGLTMTDTPKAAPPVTGPQGEPTHALPKGDDELWDADPNCEHAVYSARGGGIRCAKCRGWFCY